MRLIALLERFGHHNPQTSPDHMVDFIAYDRVVRPPREVSGGPLTRHLDGRIRRYAGMSGYNLNSFKAEAAVFANTLANPAVVHFFNGDINCRFLPALKGSSAVLATYHQPPDYFFQFFRHTDHIRKLDGVLVTSNVLCELMERFVPRDRVIFQPLAVDTDLFRPASVPVAGKRICLFVGNWLRDFETMRGVVDRLASRPDIEFRIITLAANRTYFEGARNVRFFSGIPLDAYQQHLAEADLLVVPMKSCTSNLAVLEAMAAGLPIITNDAGGIRDYVAESFATLIPGPDVEGFAEAVTGLLSDPAALKARSEAARKHAMGFSWPVIAARLAGVYRQFGADPVMAESV